MTTSLSMPAATGAAAATAAPAADPNREALREAAQQFEAVFLRQMIGSMRQARLAEDPFGSQATDTFRDMSDARLAESMSQQGSFGIAGLLMGQFQGRVGGTSPLAALNGVNSAEAATRAATAATTTTNGAAR
jgi:flagellar protein FlgJ